MPSSSALRSDNQNKALWVLVGQLQKTGLSRDDCDSILRTIVREVSGQESTRALTSAQAGAVIDRLQTRLNPSPAPPPVHRSASSKRRLASDTRGQVTPSQQQGVEYLLEALEMDKAGYIAFTKRMYKVAWPQSVEQAQGVYEGLEALLKRSYPVSQLTQVSEAIIQSASAQQVTNEDLSFAQSILDRVKAKKRLGAGQICILLKIGRRYGFHLSRKTLPPTD